MGNRECFFLTQNPPSPSKVSSVPRREERGLPWAKLTQGPRATPGDPEDETDAEIAELVPRVVEEERPQAVTLAGVAGAYCDLACGHEGRDGKERNMSGPARAVGGADGSCTGWTNSWTDRRQKTGGGQGGGGSPAPRRRRRVVNLGRELGEVGPLVVFLRLPIRGMWTRHPSPTPNCPAGPAPGAGARPEAQNS